MMKLIYRAFYALFASTVLLPQLSNAEQVEILDTLKIYNIDEVVVKSSRSNSQLKNLPQKVEIITQEEIQSLPSENLAELLKRTTNIDIIQYPGVSATIGMRGFSPSAHSRSYTLLLINGKPVGTTNLASIITSNIERIEVAKGPYSTLYGSDAMGGVINIITKVPTDEISGSFKAEYGTFDFYSAEAYISGKVVNDLLFGIGASRRAQGEEYLIGENNVLNMSDKEEAILDSASYGDKMTNSAFNINHINGLLDWKISNNWKSNIEAIYTFSDEVQTHGNYWGSYGQSKKEIERFNIYGSAEGKLGAHNTISFSPYFTKEIEPNYSDNTSDGFVSFKSDISEYGFQLQNNYAIDRLSVMAGSDFGTYNYKSNRFQSKGVPTSPYKPNNDHVNYAVFAQASYNSENFDVNAGVRFDYFKYNIEANDSINAPEASNNYSTINPSIGAQYRLNNHLKLHTSFGTAFSVPDAYKTAGSYDISYQYNNKTYTTFYKGNPNLEPEKSRTIDGGVKFNNLNRGISFDLSYFHTNHTNKIVDYYLESEEKSYKNANESLMHGLELNARYNIGTLYNNKFILELYANWTYLFDANFDETIESSIGTDSIVTKDLLYVRKSSGNFGIYFKNKLGISARLNGRYVGSRLEKDSFSRLRPKIRIDDYYTKDGYMAKNKILQHPDYLLFDASVKYTLKNNIVLGLLISNFFDENYSEKDGYNMPGRQFKINIGYKF